MAEELEDSVSSANDNINGSNSIRNKSDKKHQWGEYSVAVKVKPSLTKESQSTLSSLIAVTF